MTSQQNSVWRTTTNLLQSKSTRILATLYLSEAEQLLESHLKTEGRCVREADFLSVDAE